MKRFRLPGISWERIRSIFTGMELKRRKVEAAPMSVRERLYGNDWSENPEIVRIYVKKRPPAAVPASACRETASPGPPASGERLPALLDPALIPSEYAWENLARVVKTISGLGGFQRLRVESTGGATREYRVRNGIWASRGMRMLFAKNGTEDLRRIRVVSNGEGFPSLEDPDVRKPFEVRLAFLESSCDPVPASGNVEMPALETISPSGELPSWAEAVRSLAKAYAACCGEYQRSPDSRLLEFAETSHRFACDILGLDPARLPLSRLEVENAYRARMKVVHPDKVACHHLDTGDISQALLWARDFLCPL